MSKDSKIIGLRSTSDGKHVCLWDEGSLTWALGYAIRGAWFEPSAANQVCALAAGWLVLGDVDGYEDKDVSDLAWAARWAAERDGLPGTMRARFAHLRKGPGLCPTWATLATDRDGKATERVWRLPDLGPWAGHAVWDLGTRGGARGRYRIFVRIAGRRGGDESYEPTGLDFATQGELLAFLAVDAPREVVDANPGGAG